MLISANGDVKFGSETCSFKCFLKFTDDEIARLNILSNQGIR